MKKIVNFKKLLKISKNLRRHKKKIVFTNGIYDILHIGHVRCLQKARKQGDILVIGLNSDSSTKELKGEERPIIPERQRAEILVQLPYVNYVCIFEEESPMKILQELKPEVYVKGGDYKKEREDRTGCREFVRSYGGRVFLTELTQNISTSNIIKKIKNL